MVQKVKIHVKKSDGNFQELEVMTTTDSVTNADGSKNLTNMLNELNNPINEDQLNSMLTEIFGFVVNE